MVIGRTRMSVARMGVQKRARNPYNALRGEDCSVVSAYLLRVQEVRPKRQQSHLRVPAVGGAAGNGREVLFKRGSEWQA